MIIEFTLMKQQAGFAWQANKYYRSRPSLYQSLVIGNYLLDIDGTLLFVYQLNGIVFKKSIEVLNKDEQFCAKLKVVDDRHAVVFGMYKFSVVSLQDFKVTETVEISAMIQNVEARNNYISVLTSDEEGENKVLYCWKISKDGLVEKKYPPVDVTLPDYEECSDDRLELALIESIDHHPKIYLFWRNTNNMVEVDPVRNLEERYNRIKELTFVTDIDGDLYSEISSNKITLCSKKGGKELGSFTNEKQLFKKVICGRGEPNDYYSISDQGVKKWRLENNSEPVFYAESDNYQVENLYLTADGELVGINMEKKIVVCWKTEKDVTIHNFPNQIIRKMLRVNETQVCLMLEATISREVENEYQVEKHNKMEIYDFEKDREVAKKAVLKLQYKIDIDSSIVGSDGSILFILNEDANNDLKKHIFKWSPFTEDKKEVKKREIIGGKNFDSIKLYPFDRIITFKKAKEMEMYDPFGKAPVPKSQVTLFDCNAKKIGEYELSADIKQLQLSKNNQLYALGKDKFSIYEINSNSKNRLQKIHELQITVSFVYPFGDYIIMKKESCMLVYDGDFELLMKEDEDEQIQDYRIMRVDEKRFILGSKKEFSVWDLQKEEKESLKLEGWAPNLTELMGNRYLLVADKWIRAYDFQLLRQ